MEAPPGWTDTPSSTGFTSPPRLRCSRAVASPAEQLDVCLVVGDGGPVVDQRDGELFREMRRITGYEGRSGEGGSEAQALVLDSARKGSFHVCLLTAGPGAPARQPPAPSSPVGSGPSAPPLWLSDTCCPSPRSSAATPAGGPAPPGNPANSIGNLC